MREEEAVSYDFYLRFKDIYSSLKLKVNFKCEKCDEPHSSNFKQLNKRTIVAGAYCPKCVMSVAYSDDRWLRSNSEAQKLIQGTPAARQKNANGVARFWRENPDRLETMKINLMAAQQDPEVKRKYRERKSHNGRGISGVYKSKWGDLSFDSSYELAFLLHLETRDDIENVRRGPTIDYQLEGVDRQYLIDYEVQWICGKISWTEIKSGYIGNHRDKKEGMRAKVTAALNLINRKQADEYMLITEKSSRTRFGFSMPRGSYRSAMLRSVAAKCVWADPKHKGIYG